MEDTQHFNLITEFTDDLFEEMGITKDFPAYERVYAVVQDRVISRMFLELINAMTPLQATRVQSDLAKEGGQADAIFAALLNETPNLQGLMVQILATIRLELVADLKELSSKQV